MDLLQRVRLESGRFYGASFSKEDLTEADVSKAAFIAADLRVLVSKG